MNEKSLIKRLAFGVLFIGTFFWIVEALTQVYVYKHEGGFFYHLFPPVPHIIWHRAIVIILLFLFGLFAIYNTFRSGRSEKALRESEDKFRAICRTASDSIILIDNDGKVVYSNPAAARMFGYAEKEIYGKRLHMLFSHENPGYLEKTIFEISGDKELPGTLRSVHAINKNGTIFPVEVSVSGVKIKDGRHTIGIIRDVSEKTKLEESLKLRIKELEEFYDVTVGRELKMIALKEEIERIRNKHEDIGI